MPGVYARYWVKGLVIVTLWKCLINHVVFELIDGAWLDNKV